MSNLTPEQIKHLNRLMHVPLQHHQVCTVASL